MRDRRSGLVVAMTPEDGSLLLFTEGQEARARIGLLARTVHTAPHAALAAVVADDLPVFARRPADGQRVVHLHELPAAPGGGTHVHSLGNLAEVVLPTPKVKKGRIRVAYNATHRSR
ncbi:hypothetical protein [Streptomyces sp. NPDC050535]|uniref:hypothetical protein n=1 Tax=Streptomyces sp. NPDC050535 TaxID=3365626 RepID=UPI0037BBEC0E